MTTEPIKGFVELRSLDRFEVDGSELICTRCGSWSVYLDIEGYGASLLRVVATATDHFAECADGAS